MRLQILTKHGHTYSSDVENFTREDIEKIFKLDLYTITSKETIMTIKVSEIEAVKLANKKVETDIDNGMVYTLEVKNSIANILENIKENDVQIRDIATSTEEQLIASTEITKAVNEITESATGIESLGLDTHNIAKVLSTELQNKLEIIIHLSDTAKNLREDLEFFKIK